MAEPSLKDRYHGTCNLVILHLRRAAKSNDIDAGFATARSMGMLTDAQERFLRESLALDVRIQSGETDALEGISQDLIRQLQACILSLNTADPA